MQKKQVDKKKYMRKLYPWLLGMILGIMPCIVSASENDSIKVESLLQKAARLPADSCRILFFAQNLLGVPYVANTLDGTDEERLVVHLDKVDCTTLVETVLALSLADKYNPQIQISAESETKRSIFREKDKTKRSKKESAQHSKSRNKSFVMTSVSAL